MVVPVQCPEIINKGRTGSTKSTLGQNWASQLGSWLRQLWTISVCIENGPYRLDRHRLQIGASTGVDTMKTFLKNFLTDEAGASAAEYALILAIVGVAIGAGALVLGENVATSINNAGKNVGKCANAANTVAAPAAVADEDGVDGTECD